MRRGATASSVKAAGGQPERRAAARAERFSPEHGPGMSDLHHRADAESLSVLWRASVAV